MNEAEGSIVVTAPVGSVYRRWLRFEDSPQFMTPVKRAKRLDRNHFQMSIACSGKQMDGMVEIMLRVPERRIAWRVVTGGSPCDHLATGVVSFTTQSDGKTCIGLKISCSGVGGELSDRVNSYLNNFKRLVEAQNE